MRQSGKEFNKVLVNGSPIDLPASGQSNAFVLPVGETNTVKIEGVSNNADWYNFKNDSITFVRGPTPVDIIITCEAEPLHNAPPAIFK